MKILVLKLNYYWNKLWMVFIVNTKKPLGAWELKEEINVTKANKSVLEMDHIEAYDFFLKTESYISFKLPSYFDFKSVLALAEQELIKANCELKCVCNGISKLSDSEDVNYMLLMNKDNDMSWRPLQIIHPILYVYLVKQITIKENWDKILSRFKEFTANEKILCYSIPLASTSKNSDKAETITSHWINFEQKTIANSLHYKYCINTDIANCYSSIYTHTIAWAIETKESAKANRKSGLGNKVDKTITWMQCGQTNGIPQGSVIMDFIAEIVLGYADLLLSNILVQLDIEDFKVIRYRDDYRIFSNNKETTKVILKELTVVLMDLNLKINPRKTFFSSNIILDAMKPSKTYWESIEAGLFDKDKNDNYKISIQRHLIQIRLLAQQFPNCGSLMSALTELYKKKIIPLSHPPRNTEQLISIVVDIMESSPNTIVQCVAILSHLFTIDKKINENDVVESILSKYKDYPNIEFIEIWLQRLRIGKEGNEFDSKLCKKIDCQSINIWNSSWLKNGFDETSIVNRMTLHDNEDKSIPYEEISLFDY